MKELLLYIARNLVDHPDQVSVTEVGEADDLTLELRVAPEDMGKVIGRQGRIAKEIRTVVRSYAQRTGVKVIRVHDIRHSHASLLINMGTDALLVQQRLGHEKVSTTLGTYAHLYPDRANNVADCLEALACPEEKKP